MAKVKIATDWLESCAGCHMSILDIDEKIVDLIKFVDITSSPITDLKHPPKEGVDVGILSGGIGNSDHEKTAKEMRERCKILVALGDCAVFGGICNLRNFIPKENILKRGYVETESTTEGKVPESGELGKLTNQVSGVNMIVKVDIFIPGCPPSADSIYYSLTELVNGRIPVLEGKLLHYD